MIQITETLRDKQLGLNLCKRSGGVTKEVEKFAFVVMRLPLSYVARNRHSRPPDLIR